MGPDEAVLARLGEAFGSRATVLDRHSDAVHGRSVFTLAAPANRLVNSLLAGAEAALELIDLREHGGAHPRIGALDVCPVVFADSTQAGEAEAAALDVAAGLGDLGLPVFRYGRLASAEERRERHFFRRGGLEALAARMGEGLDPDDGPACPHPSAGAVLVTARPPLAAFNVEVEGLALPAAEDLAGKLRESGGGPEGVRAIAIELDGDRIQISTNVHDPGTTPLAKVVAEVRRLAGAAGGRPVAAELIGLVPEAALDGYPDDVPIAEFDAGTGTIEAALRSLG